MGPNTNTDRRPKPKKTMLAPEDYLDAAALKRIRDYVRRRAKTYPSYKAQLDRVLVELMVGSGLRSGVEVCKLDMRDLPIYHRQFAIHVRCGKRGKARTVQIHKRLAGLLSRFVREHRGVNRYTVYDHPDDAVFLGGKGRRLRYRDLYTKIRRLGKAALLRKISPHVLRHTFATWLYSQDNDILNTQEQLGHANVATTQIYARTASVAARKQADKLW